MRIAIHILPAYSHVMRLLELMRMLVEDGHYIVVFTSRRFEAELAEIGCNIIVDQDEHIEEHHRLSKVRGWGLQFILQGAEKVYPTWRKYHLDMGCDVLIGDEGLIVPKLLARDLNLPFVLFSSKCQLQKKQGSTIRLMHLRTWFANPISFFRFLRDIRVIPKRMQRKYELQDFSTKSIFMSSDCDLFIAVVPPGLVQDDEPIPEHFCFLKPDIASRAKVQMLSTQNTVLPWENLKTKKSIYISLGTVFNNAKSVYKKLMMAVKDLDAEVILSVPANVRLSLPSDALCRWHVVRFAPQIELLKIVDVFVSHCGANSLLEAVHFQVPIVCVPQAADQFANARHIEKIDLGINLGNQFTERDARQAIHNMAETSREEYRSKVTLAMTSDVKQVDEKKVIQSIVGLVNI